MRKAIISFPVIFLASTLLGCTPNIVPDAGKIDLETAMESVGRGLVKMKNAEIAANGDKDFTSGLVASEGEVTFNISAAGTDTGKLYVELSPIPQSPEPIGGKAGAGFDSSYTASRGNQITIKFKSLLFEKPASTGSNDSKTKAELIKELKDAGVTVYSHASPKTGILQELISSGVRFSPVALPISNSAK